VSNELHLKTDSIKATTISRDQFNGSSEKKQRATVAPEISEHAAMAMN